MWKKLVSVLLLLSLSASFGLAQDLASALSYLDRLKEIIAELESIRQERTAIYEQLQNMNDENLKELQERDDLLKQKETELLELKRQLELFGELIDQNAAYTRKLERSSKFWRITSIVLAGSLATTLVIWGVSNK